MTSAARAGCRSPASLPQQSQMPTVSSLDGREAKQESHIASAQVPGALWHWSPPTCPSSLKYHTGITPLTTHQGRGPQRAWPAPLLLLWKRCLCTPEGGRAKSMSLKGQSPGATGRMSRAGSPLPSSPRALLPLPFQLCVGKQRQQLLPKLTQSTQQLLDFAHHPHGIC